MKGKKTTSERNNKTGSESRKTGGRSRGRIQSSNPDELLLLQAKVQELTRQVVEARRGLWGNMAPKRIHPAAWRKIIETVRGLSLSSGVSQGKIREWIGVSADDYALWEKRYPEILSSYFAQRELVKRWVDALLNPRVIMGSFLAVVVFDLVAYFLIDRPVAQFFHTFRNALFFKVTAQFTYLGESVFFLTFSLFGYFLTRRRDYELARKTLFFFYSVLFSGVAVNLFKPVLGRARPEVLFIDGTYGFDIFRFQIFGDMAHNWHSFPSGHSATGFAVGLSLALLFPSRRWYFLAFGLLIALSRVVIHAHYVSDAVTGSWIGLFTVVLIYDRLFIRGHRGVDARG